MVLSINSFNPETIEAFSPTLQQSPKQQNKASMSSNNSTEEKVEIEMEETIAATTTVPDVSIANICSLSFTVTDGIVLVNGNDDNKNNTREEKDLVKVVDFENFTGQCELQSHVSVPVVNTMDSSSSGMLLDHGGDYAAGATIDQTTNTTTVTAAVAAATTCSDDVVSGTDRGSRKSSRILDASADLLPQKLSLKSSSSFNEGDGLTSDNNPNNTSNNTSNNSSNNNSTMNNNKVYLQTEHEYAVSLIKRERLNFYEASTNNNSLSTKKKHTLFGNVPNASAAIMITDNDDLASKASVDSSITNSVMSSVTSNLSLFSQGNASRMRKMAAFQPMKAEKEMSVCCNVCGEAFSSIVSGKKRHNCRYCKDTVCTTHSVIDPSLPVPFKNVRLCSYCNTDVTAGRYRTLRRFYTSLVYLKPMSYATTANVLYPGKEYEQLRVALSALCQELDAILVKIIHNLNSQSRGPSISVSPEHLVHALGRHLYVSNGPEQDNHGGDFAGGGNTSVDAEDCSSEAASIMPIQWNSLQFRDGLYLPTRLLSTLLAICHIRQDYRYALACHDQKDIRQNAWSSLQHPVDVVTSLCSVLEVKIPILCTEAKDEEREEHEVLLKAARISQEQAARSLFYITHPKVYHLANTNKKSNGAAMNVIDVTQANRVLQFTMKCLQKPEMTHLYPRFGIALVHNLLLQYGAQLTLDWNLVQTLTTLLSTSEDLDARVHSIAALWCLLQTGSNSTTDVTRMILDAPDFNFYGIAELLTLGNNLICETCVNFLLVFSETELDVSIELSNENSCLKALVHLMNNEEEKDLEFSLQILRLFSNMAQILIQSKQCTGVMALRRKEGLQNFQSENILKAALQILESVRESSGTERDNTSNNSINAPQMRLYAQAGKLVSLLHTYFMSQSNMMGADTGKKVYWEDPNQDNGTSATQPQAPPEAGNLLPVHMLLSKKYFSYKQLDYMLTYYAEAAANNSNAAINIAEILSQTDDSGKIPLQILANNKDFLTQNNEALSEIVKRLVAENPRTIMRQDERALSPFFVTINDWAVFAQRGYESNIHAQERKFKLSRFRKQNTMSKRSSRVSTVNNLIAPRLEMTQYVYASLVCLSHMVDYLGYKDQHPQSSILSEFDVVKFVAQIPDFLKLIFFIEDATMREKVLNLSIVQRALMYDDYLIADGGLWIRELSPEKYQIFVEKWLYAFDVARSKYRLALKDDSDLLKREDRKMAAIVEAMKKIVAKAVVEAKKSKKNKKDKSDSAGGSGASSDAGGSSGQKKNSNKDRIERYQFLIYYLEFVL